MPALCCVSRLELNDVLLFLSSNFLFIIPAVVEAVHYYYFHYHIIAILYIPLIRYLFDFFTYCVLALI